MADDWMDKVDRYFGQTPSNEGWMDKVDKYYRHIDDGKRSAVVGNSVWSNPDQFAKLRESSKKVGTPWTLAEKMSDEINAEARKREVLEKTQNSEALRKAFEDAEFARLAHDDVDNLSLLEQTLVNAWRMYKGPEVGWRQGKAEIGTGRIGYDISLTGVTTEEQGKRLREFQETMREARPPSYGLGEFAKLLAQMTELLPGSIEYGMKTGMATGAASLLAGPGAPLAAGPSTAAGFGAGVMAEMGRQAWEVEAGSQYLELMEAGIPHDVAQIGSTITGAVNGALEIVGFKFISDPIKKGIRSAIKKKLRDMTKTEAGKRFLKNWGTAMAGETSTEMVQEFVNEVVMAVSGEYSFEDFQSKFETEEGRAEIFDRIAGIGIEVGLGMAWMGPIGAGFNFAVDMSAAKRAEQNKAVFEALGDTAEKSKVRERAPEKYQSFIEEATKDGPVDSVYLNSDTFVEYFQSQGMDPNDVANELGVASELEEALANRGDVRIPIGTYTAKLAGTEHHQGLVEDIKFNPDDFTAREAAQWQKNLQAQWKEEAKKVQERMESDTTFAESAERVHQAIIDQLVNTGMSREFAEGQSILYKSQMMVRAEREGITPEQAAEKYGLRVTSTLQDQGGLTLDQALYHGSPHRFTKFLMDKIGTGEGAQAYGHGLYFAESPGVAKSYQADLSDYRVEFDGVPVDQRDTAESIKTKIPALSDSDAEIIVQVSHSAFTDPQKKGVDGVLKSWKSAREFYSAAFEDADKSDPIYAVAMREIDELTADIIGLERVKDRLKDAKGSLYEVDIPDSAIDNMLDWDKPLSEQSASTRQAIENNIGDIGLSFDESAGLYSVIDSTGTHLTQHTKTRESALSQLTGEQIYKTANRRSISFLTEHGLQKGRNEVRGGSAAHTSNYFNSLGIPGIKYLDQASRGKGEGTRNIVVFDPELIKIKTIDGKPVKPIDQVKITEEFEVSETGEKITVEQTGKEALKEIDERIENLNKLIDCLAA